MIGSILGDIRSYEYSGGDIAKGTYTMFGKIDYISDASVMTAAVAYAIMNDCQNITREYQEMGRMYTQVRYGDRFYDWLRSNNPRPYNSCGSGAATRISAVGWAARSEEEVKDLARKLTEVSHNHPEGIKGAECTAMCVYLARNGKDKDQIRSYVNENYYPMVKTLDDWKIFNSGRYDSLVCQISVPQAIECFLESSDFEDCIRKCVSAGGDGRVLAAIAGAIAEAYYGLPEQLWQNVRGSLSGWIRNGVHIFYDRYIFSPEETESDRELREMMDHMDRIKNMMDESLPDILPLTDDPPEVFSD